MSEQNILNPTATSALNPDYSVKVSDPVTMSRFQARSGKPFGRRLAARGAVFDLMWQARMFADYLALAQWIHQYENDFFTFSDYDTGRYYSGQFADAPTFERAGNNKVNIQAQFIEVPTLPMYQYPSNWARDAVFIEERASWPVPTGISGAINDLVKITGAWDRRDQNYLLQSQDLELPPWSVQNGCTVTADQVAGPDGTVTADKLTAGNVATSTCFQAIFVVFAEQYTFAIDVLAGTATQVAFGIFGPSGWEPVAVQIVSGPGSISGGSPTLITGLSTTQWTRVAITTNNKLTAGASYNCHIAPGGASANTGTNYVTWAQVESGTTPTTYTKTTSSTLTLVAPAPNANYHGGYAYFDPGVNALDTAEWLYFGYGFQLWSPKGPDYGIVQISLDKVIQGTVDCYAAALTASAVIFTMQNIPLGQHRVTLAATDTKNASSSAFKICADALQVMR